MSEEIGYATSVMSQEMRGKLASYMTSLQARYGDPRVYEMEREQMAARQAEVAHAQAKTREQALAAAYSNNREQIRSKHQTRIQRWSQGKRPESQQQVQ